MRVTLKLATSLDGKTVGPLDLVIALKRIGGENGVGRIDHLENRLIGIKSREIYEAPAAVLLLQAHQALEDITLPKEVARFKDTAPSPMSGPASSTTDSGSVRCATPCMRS